MERSKKINLLIVDDDVSTARSLQLMISKKYENINVETANGGFAAMRRIRQGGIDAVLTDVAMPDMNGCDLYRKIMETNDNIQVIMMSAYYDPSHSVVKAKLEGLKDVVPSLELIEKKDLVEQIFKKIEEHFLK
ncbi:MAG: response regulator [Candidatus Stygibacter australis]|nr:response regulator [Candidatus Stygibacter australis]MDP8321225.1 response regulator [Candidatus Stygibacter australis]